MRALLSAEGLTVARGRRVLLEGLWLDLSPGETVQIAGANGCGKSSVLRALAGVVEPRRGAVRRDVPCIYVPERPSLPESLPARRWARITGADDARVASDLDQRCGALSKGQLQRLVLSSTLDVAPPTPTVLLLDEPWAGLDTDGRAALDGLLASAGEAGSAVLNTDHGRATSLDPTRTVALTPLIDEAGPPTRVAVELVRDGEHVRLTVDDAALATRLSDGWELERAEPLR